MYGLTGNLTPKSGKRDVLTKILLQGAAELPGCLNYIISKDEENSNLIWVTELGESKPRLNRSEGMGCPRKTDEQQILMGRILSGTERRIYTNQSFISV